MPPANNTAPCPPVTACSCLVLLLPLALSPPLFTAGAAHACNSVAAAAAGYWVSMLSEMSRALTLWVSAPQEMNCTPVSAITLYAHGWGAGAGGGTSRGRRSARSRQVHGAGGGRVGQAESEPRALHPTHRAPLGRGGGSPAARHLAPHCVQRHVAAALCLHDAPPNQLHSSSQHGHIKPSC